MNLFYQGCEVFATIVETYVFLDFLTKFLGKRFSTIRQNIAFIIAFFLINFYMITVNHYVLQYSAFSDVVVLALYMLYALFCSKGNLLLKIITPTITMTAISLINLSTLYLISFIFSVDLNEITIERNRLRLLVLIITKMFFFLSTRLILKHFKPKEIVLSGKEYFAVSLSFLCSVIIILYFAEFQLHFSESQIGYYSVVVLLSVVLINIASSILFVMLVKRNKENTRYMMIQVQFHEQQKMYQSICSAYKNLEILQHDMKNDLLTLQTLIHQKHLIEAEEFIESYTKTKLEKFEIFVHTGFELIDAVINIKLNYAREKEIEVFCHISADFSPFETEDIVSLFSNAIDNATEASVKCAKRYISILIENKRNYLCMKIGNAIENSVLAQNEKLLTTKQDKQFHGFGKQSMLNIVQKYDGMMEYYENNGMFFVDILLKNTK